MEAMLKVTSVLNYMHIKSSFDKNDVFQTRGDRVGGLGGEEKASFKNSVMTDADCMSGCFGKKHRD